MLERDADWPPSRDPPEPAPPPVPDPTARRYSKPIAIVYGTARVGGTEVYIGTPNTHPGTMYVTNEQGALVDSPGSKFAPAAIALCEGPIEGLAPTHWFEQMPHTIATLARLGPQFLVYCSTAGAGVTTVRVIEWAGTHLVAPGDYFEQAGVSRKINAVTLVSSGIYDLTLDSAMTVAVGFAKFWPVVELAPGGNFGTGDRTGTLWSATGVVPVIYHGGTAYVRCRQMYLPNGEMPRDLAFEVQGFKRRGSGVNPDDANPSDMLKDLLTSAVYGTGLATGKVEVVLGQDGTAASGFDAYCKAKGYALSWAITQQEKASKLVEQALLACNATLLSSGAKLKILPLDDLAASSAEATYTPYITATALSEDDFLKEGDREAIAAERAADDDVDNVFPVSFVTREYEYNQITVESMDPALVEDQGGLVRRASAVDLGSLVVPVVQAQQVSQAMASQANFGQLRFKFKLSPRHLLLEAMDYVSLTHARFGLSDRLARIISIEIREDFSLEVTAVDWPLGKASAVSHNAPTLDGVASDAGKLTDPRALAQAGAEVLRPILPLQAWDLSTGEAGFTLSNGTAAAGDAGNTFRRHTATTNDMQLARSDLAMDPSKSYVVLARVRVVQGAWGGQLFWANAGHGYTEAFSQNAGAPPIGTWAIVKWDLRLSPDFMGATLTGLRFDFMNGNGDIIEVDWIAAGQEGAIDGYLGGVQQGAVTVDKVSPSQYDTDNLWPNPSSEMSPPPGADTTQAEWADRVNAGAGAYSGSWVRQPAGGQNGGFWIPCSPGTQIYVEAQVKRLSGAGLGGRVVVGFYPVFGSFAGGSWSNSPFVTVGTWTKTSVVSVAAPAGTNAAYVFYDVPSAGDTVQFDALYARRVVDGVMVVGSIQTSNYAEDGSGNPTAGAKITSGATTPAKFGPGGAKVGRYELSEPVLATLTALARSGVGVNDVTWYRGNVTSGVDGGAPRLIEALWERGKTYAVGDRVRSDGTLTAPAYAGGTTYFYGSIVSYATSGGVYICFNDNGGAGIVGQVPTNTTYWRKIGAATADTTGAYCTESLGGRAPARVYTCVTAGASSTTGNGPTGVGSGISDGAAAWDYVEAISAASDRLTITARAGTGFVATASYGGGTKYLVAWKFALQPRLNLDNLDGLRYLQVELFNTAGGTAYDTFYVQVPDRLYKVPGTPTDAGNGWALATPHYMITGGGVNTASPYCYWGGPLKVTPFNAFGPGVWRMYGAATNLGQPPNSTSTAYTSGHVDPGAAPAGGGGGGGGECPAPEVPVLMADGSEKPAGELRVGDRIWTVPEDGEPGDHAVTAVRLAEGAERVALELSTGERLTYSPRHLVLTAAGWVAVRELRPGARLLTLQGACRVTSVAAAPRGQVVKISTAARTYVTSGGVMNHNMKAQ